MAHENNYHMFWRSLEYPVVPPWQRVSGISVFHVDVLLQKACRQVLVFQCAVQIPGVLRSNPLAASVGDLYLEDK